MFSDKTRMKRTQTKTTNSSPHPRSARPHAVLSLHAASPLADRQTALPLRDMRKPSARTSLRDAPSPPCAPVPDAGAGSRAAGKPAARSRGTTQG
eukprot:scaffold1735_cov119-Isochrysis_galbana.AAC.7